MLFLTEVEQNYCVKRIYAGGDQSFAHYYTANVRFHQAMTYYILRHPLMSYLLLL